MTRSPYQESGVDPDKAANIISKFSLFLKTRPKDPHLISGIGPFASAYSIQEKLRGLQHPMLITCCDGVGTKVKLGLEWGDISGLGRDLVAMNVNDLLCCGATPLVFLDYYASGKLEEEEFLTLLKSIQEGCELANCSLAGGETAEMPGLYQGKDFDLAGFAVGLADRSQLLGPKRVSERDVLLAIESSGFHSNGYSLIRRIISDNGLLPHNKPFGDKTWKEILLSPTLIYVAALKESLGVLSAAAHITGGGLFENLTRVIPEGHQAVIAASRWSVPDPFLWFRDKARLTQEELLSTFNCGVGMILICRPTVSASVQAKVEACGLRCWEIGEVIRGSPPVVWND